MATEGFFKRLKFWKRGVDPHGQSESTLQNKLAHRLKRYDKYFSHFQSLIMWENPAESVICIIGVNLLFWLFVSLEWRFYGIVSSVLLIMSVYDCWVEAVWPEISVSSSAPADNTPASPSVIEISKTVANYWEMLKHSELWLRNLRTQYPARFCALVSGTCVLLLLVGSSVSGLVLSYLILMAALLSPGVLRYCVPPELKNSVAAHFLCVRQAFAKYTIADASDDEYIPMTTSEDMALLTRASDFHHDTYDSITNPGTSSDLVSGLGMMPSHEEDSLASLSDLEPASLLPIDPAEDSDDNHDDHQIQFQSGHFNGDSSSDEEAFTKGLDFSTETDETDSLATRGLSSFITRAVTSNMMGSVGLLANVLRNRQTTSENSSDTSRRQTTRQQSQPLLRKNSDSDNDGFEIIDSDELNSQDST